MTVAQLSPGLADELTVTYPSSGTSTAAYARRLSRRTQSQTFLRAIVLVAVFAAAVARSGWAQATILLSVLLAVGAGAVGAFIGRGRVREGRRRRRGEYPSWTALAPRSVVGQLHPHGDVDSRELGEVPGRLSRTAAGYEWVARSLRDRGTGQLARVMWPADVTVETYRVWGLGQRGLVRFVTSEGDDAILTVWRSNDLFQVLHQSSRNR